MCRGVGGRQVNMLLHMLPEEAPAMPEGEGGPVALDATAGGKTVTTYKDFPTIMEVGGRQPNKQHSRHASWAVVS